MFLIIFQSVACFSSLNDILTVAIFFPLGCTRKSRFSLFVWDTNGFLLRNAFLCFLQIHMGSTFSSNPNEILCTVDVLSIHSFRMSIVHSSFLKYLKTSMASMHHYIYKGESIFCKTAMFSETMQPISMLITFLDLGSRCA